MTMSTDDSEEEENFHFLGTPLDPITEGKWNVFSIVNLACIFIVLQFCEKKNCTKWNNKEKVRLSDKWQIKLKFIASDEAKQINALNRLDIVL